MRPGIPYVNTGVSKRRTPIPGIGSATSPEPLLKPLGTPLSSQQNGSYMQELINQGNSKFAISESTDTPALYADAVSQTYAAFQDTGGLLKPLGSKEIAADRAIIDDQQLERNAAVIAPVKKIGPKTLSASPLHSYMSGEETISNDAIEMSPLIDVAQDFNTLNKNKFRSNDVARFIGRTAINAWKYPRNVVAGLGSYLTREKYDDGSRYGPLNLLAGSPVPMSMDKDALKKSRKMMAAVGKGKETTRDAVNKNVQGIAKGLLIDEAYNGLVIQDKESTPSVAGDYYKPEFRGR